MAEHSPADWQKLIAELRKVVADPKRTREDRAKAQGILDRIGPARLKPPQPRRPMWDSDSYYTDEIV